MFAIFETWIPLRALTESTERRWGAHGLLFGCAVILQNVLVRVSPLPLAASLLDSPWGLLNRPALPGDSATLNWPTVMVRNGPPC